MAIQKANPNLPYGQDLAPEDDVNTQEYRPVATFSVSKVYTVANKPAAASGNTSIVIWVVDAPPGEQLQFSDGTNWLPIRY